MAMSLGDAILDPVESHVDGFGPLLPDGVVGETNGSGYRPSWRGRWVPSSTRVV
jgi:hypothetical protein